MTAPGKPGSTRMAKGHKLPMLAPDVTRVDYKDVTLLRTFVSDRGKIRSRRITGLTPQQQRMVTRAVKNARGWPCSPTTAADLNRRGTPDPRPRREGLTARSPRSPPPNGTST